MGTINLRGKKIPSRGMLKRAPPNPVRDRKKKANSIMH
tara:strand:+ start:221 stop:334 length:114 start_codon:yes stop_codon:yes gene_type:complete